MGHISQALGSAGLGQAWPVGTAGGRLAGRRKGGASFSLSPLALPQPGPLLIPAPAG